MEDIQKIVGFALLYLFTTDFTNAITYKSFEHKNPFLYEFDITQDRSIYKRTNVPSKISETYNNKMSMNNFKVAQKNLHTTNDQTKPLRDGEVVEYNPGDNAPSFSIWDVNEKISFPDSKFVNKSLLIHVFDPDSGFLECMWNSDAALSPLVDQSVNHAHFIFIPKRAKINEVYGALWMQTRLKTVFLKAKHSSGVDMSRIHISVVPLSNLGNWIPSVFQQWQCVDHLCGLDQVVIELQGQNYPIILKRLDAHYDWLPSPASVFNNNTLPLVYGGDGCSMVAAVNKSVAMVTSMGCSYFKKVSLMQNSGALGVIVLAFNGQPVQDMNCMETECATQLSIPAAFVEHSDIYLQTVQMNITFQNTPTSNFFMAIDRSGNLAEVGWFLYPSMNFLIWQAQWFDYQMNLNKALSASEMTVDIFKDQVMQGDTGVVVNVTLPDINELRQYSKMELDMSLSCPGTKDTTCAHWDHTVNLFICCDQSSLLCGMELGRWITAFRRRIGRWLTDVSSLLPLFTSNTCTFTMKTAPWAMPWVPSLSLRFSQKRSAGDSFPAHVLPLYMPGATFDKDYNSHFKQINFTVSNNVTKVEIFSVITGHGSDENGCGEFCVTSHYFTVNKVKNNITFSTAGTPLGCADLVHTGVEPNEHGTWLYGRNGWCDGRNVFPWVIDVTSQIKNSGYINTVKYFGYFNGTDPDPKQNPGIISIYSYLIFYEKFLK